MPNKHLRGIADPARAEREEKGIDAPWDEERKLGESGDIEMAAQNGYLPYGNKGPADGLGQKTMGKSGHPTASASGSGSPFPWKLQEEEAEFDDGGFFDEQEFSDEELAEAEAGEEFEAFAAQQNMMFSVIGAIADRLGMSFGEDGSIYFAEDEGQHFEESDDYSFDEHGDPVYFAEGDDEDDVDDGPSAPYAKGNGNGNGNGNGKQCEEFSADPYLNSRITALEMREKQRNHSEGVNNLVEQCAASLSEYHLDTEDVDRMREVAFSSDNPKAALHQFSAIIKKNVPTDPPHTFTDYLSHDAYAQNVPEEVQQFAAYGPDMYSTAESLWAPYQQYKASTNSQIDFKDYVKAQGQLGSTTNTGEGN